MSSAILYSFRRCPYAMRARMVLHYSLLELGQKIELREVVLSNKPQAMLELSPKATVPVLVITDAGRTQVIDESLAIMVWALERSDSEEWRINEPCKHPLIERNDGYFKYSLDRYKYPNRYQADELRAFQQHHFELAHSFLVELESALVKNHHDQFFLETAKPNFLDVAVFPFVRQFFAVDRAITERLDLPKLKAWHDYFIKAEVFTRVMTKYSPWEPANEPIWFGALI